jgi:hypothetical protein
MAKTLFSGAAGGGWRIKKPSGTGVRIAVTAGIHRSVLFLVSVCSIVSVLIALKTFCSSPGHFLKDTPVAIRADKTLFPFVKVW